MSSVLQPQSLLTIVTIPAGMKNGRGFPLPNPPPARRVAGVHGFQPMHPALQRFLPVLAPQGQALRARAARP